MDLVNLKTGTDKFQDEDGKTVEKDNFPWGLRVSLNNETMKKLGMSLPKVGSEMMLAGKVRVLSTSSHDDGDETCNNVELQITDLGLMDSDSEPKKSAASTLYGGDE